MNGLPQLPELATGPEGLQFTQRYLFQYICGVDGFIKAEIRIRNFETEQN